MTAVLQSQRTPGAQRWPEAARVPPQAAGRPNTAAGEPLFLVRAHHRKTHLDEIERVLG